MNTKLICIASSLIVVGVIAIGLGIRTRLGKNRAWYLVPNYYVLLPKAGHYAMPIGGLMLITLGISLFLPNSEIGDKIMYWGALPLMIMVLLVVIFQPKWLKPKWVRWLEENHGDILELLIEEARKTPKWTDWATRVSTQEGLEAWVEEVRRKHGLEKR